MNEVQFSTEFFDGEDKAEEEEDKDEKPVADQSQITLGKGYSYQIGIITEIFTHTTLQAYLNFFYEKDMPIPEDKAWLIIIQLTDVLAHCTKLGFWHCNIRPDTVFVRGDHKTLTLSYFGKAKFIDYYSKDCIRYLAPTILAQMESSKSESDKKRTSKDDVFSVGYTIAEMCLTGAVLPYVTALNKDSTGENLKKILHKLQTGGYSEHLLKYLE